MAMTSVDFAPRFPRLRGNFLKTINHLVAVRQQRIALKTLDGHRLQDLGLDSKQALNEANRPFWDAPAHWKR